jgi:hypothetical protein
MTPTKQQIDNYYESHKPEIEAAWKVYLQMNLSINPMLNNFINGYCYAKLSESEVERAMKASDRMTILAKNGAMFCGANGVWGVSLHGKDATMKCDTFPEALAALIAE